MNEEKIYVNRRLVFSELLIWLAVCIGIYLAFTEIRGMDELEEIILLVFLLIIIIWRSSKFLQVFPTIILSEQGLTYRTDFKKWEEIEQVELVPAKFGLAFTQKLRLYTTIAGEEIVIWNIMADDSRLALPELMKQIEIYRQHHNHSDK